MTILASDPFLGVCTLSRQGFIDALRARPANRDLLDEREPGQYWDECRAWSVDPNFLLAMFLHESSFGTAGTAMTTMSWGNTRSPSFGAVPVGLVGGRSGEFPSFFNWRDGLASTAGRLASPVWPAGAPYGSRDTIREVFDHPSNQVWAPSSDLNDPDSYLSQVVAVMNRWQDQAAEPVEATRVPTPPVYSSYLTVNYTRGRLGHPVRAIILHVTGGPSAASAINWFSNPASHVSSHYVVDRDGDIYATVDEDDTAWVNGIVEAPNVEIPIVAEWVRSGVNPNLETIGIEVAGYSSMQPDPDEPDLNGYTDRQFRALAYLLPALNERHDVPLEPDFLFGHCDISGTQRANCPGLSEAEWEEIYQMSATSYDNANDAFDAYLAQWDDEALWAGQIVGKEHWYGREPQELVRTVGNRLLAYDGALAQDASGYSLDEWEIALKASGQLTIWGQETPPDPNPPQPEVPVGAAWPIHPGDGAALTGVEQTFMWGKDAPTADIEIYRATGEPFFGVERSDAVEVDVVLPSAGDYLWTVRGRDGYRTSEWTTAHFTVVAAPAPPDPKPPRPPRPPINPSKPYPPVVSPTYQADPAAMTWRNVSDQKIDLAVSRRWRPDCDGGVGPWPDTAQWLEPSFPGANTAASPLELRKLVRRLSMHPPIVETAYRLNLWERVPATFKVDGSEWEDDAAKDYGDDWGDMPAHAQRWAQQICTLATAIQQSPTLGEAFFQLLRSAVEAEAWAARYHCLRRRVRDLSEVAGC